LNVGVLRPESALIGKTVEACYQEVGGNDLEIIAILRGGDVVFPQQDTVLQKGDRLLIIGSSKARGRIVEHLAPVPGSKDQTVVS
ncbi:MAG: TrkA C-terminal domain-containing protein, partial [Terriglobales bacterium]